MVDRLCSFLDYVTLIGPIGCTTKGVGQMLIGVFVTFRSISMLVGVLEMQREFMKLRFNVHNVAVPKKTVLSISMILNEMVIAKSN